VNSVPFVANSYSRLVSDISGLLERARRTSARSINSILTATYWEIGRRIVEYEQGGQARSEYGEKLLDRLAKDLTAEHGRGFSRSNVAQMRALYLAWQIVQTPSGQFEAQVKCPTLSGKSGKKKRQTPSAKSAQALVPFPAPIRSLPKQHLAASNSSAVLLGWQPGWQKYPPLGYMDTVRTSETLINLLPRSFLIVS